MIAQQDYLHFKQSMPIAASYDCELLAFLVGGIERRTIWDMIITTYPENDFDDTNAQICRVSQVSSFDGEFVLASGPISYRLDYSSANYSGLAAIQKALLAAGESVTSVPVLVDNDTYIGIVEMDYHLTTPDGYEYRPVLDDNGKLASILVSDSLITENALPIAVEDAQKLIGIKLM